MTGESGSAIEWSYKRLGALLADMASDGYEISDVQTQTAEPVDEKMLTVCLERKE